MFHVTPVSELGPRALRGGCHCGRYQYMINRPEMSDEIAHVKFDGGRLQSRQYNSTIPAYLQVPLAWYISSAHPQYDNEYRRDIQQYFSPHDESMRRNFCGFCGTPVSFWNWHDRHGHFIQIPLNTLAPRDLYDLEDLGYVDTGSSRDSSRLPDRGVGSSRQLSSPGEGLVDASHESVATADSMGVPWFDAMLRRYHGITRTSGATVSLGGTISQWDIVEWNKAEVGGEDNTLSSSGSPEKRKRRDSQTSEPPSKR